MPDRPNSTVLPVVPSNDLNWLAEKANGFQGEALTVFLNPVTGHVGINRATKALPEGSEPLFNVFDEDVKMPSPKAVDLTFSKSESQGGVQDETHNLLKEHPEADALFWSASAIEKFVIPYYVAHRLLSEAELKNLEKAYKSGNIVAVLHVRPSIPFTYPETSNSEYKVYARKGMTLDTGPIDLLDYVKELLKYVEGLTEEKGQRPAKPEA